MSGDRLEFDLADRMRRALRVSGLGVQDVADHLGVARNTVSTWINGRIVPDKRTLMLWAMRTGVPLEWLETGRVTSPDNGPNDGTNIDVTTRHDGTCVGLRRLELAAAA